MSRIHNLKILNDFADGILMGDKNFEVRKNDRGFQKGDGIKFQAIDNSGIPNTHIINNKIYEITYVLSGWGIENGYVVLAIRESEGGMNDD